MRNLRITLAYDGTEFAGWQVQPGRTTVQGTLASAIGRLSGENVLPQASGRTDAGVHATGQVVSFATASPIPEENWMRALNDILPTSIRVLNVIAAASDFHARKSARAKTYRYRVLRSDVCSPFLARYVWHYPYPLNEKEMIDAAGLVVGKHDFTSFAAVDPERVERMLAADKEPADNVTTTSSIDLFTDSITDSVTHSITHSITNVRTIFSSAWVREGEEFVYTVRGSGFLHHMVRNLVGTFFLLGKGTFSQDDLHRIIDARIRASAGPTAPASGLFLADVEY